MNQRVGSLGWYRIGGGGGGGGGHILINTLKTPHNRSFNLMCDSNAMVAASQ